MNKAVIMMIVVLSLMHTGSIYFKEVQARKEQRAVDDFINLHLKDTKHDRR